MERVTRNKFVYLIFLPRDVRQYSLEKTFAAKDERDGGSRNEGKGQGEKEKARKKKCWSLQGGCSGTSVLLQSFVINCPEDTDSQGGRKAEVRAGLGRQEH